MSEAHQVISSREVGTSPETSSPRETVASLQTTSPVEPASSPETASPVETSSPVENTAPTADQASASQPEPRPSNWKEPNRNSDPLRKLPKKDLTYVNGHGEPTFNGKYDYYAQQEALAKTKKRKQAQAEKQAEKQAKKKAKTQTKKKIPAKKHTKEVAELRDKGSIKEMDVLAAESVAQLAVPDTFQALINTSPDLCRSTDDGVVSFEAKSGKNITTPPNTNDTQSQIVVATSSIDGEGQLEHIKGKGINKAILPDKHCQHGCIIPLRGLVRFNGVRDTCLHGFIVHEALSAPAQLPDHPQTDADPNKCLAGCEFSIKVPHLVKNDIANPLAANSLHEPLYQCSHGFGVYQHSSSGQNDLCPYECNMNTCAVRSVAAEEQPMLSEAEPSQSSRGEYKACAHSFGTLQFILEVEEEAKEQVQELPAEDDPDATISDPGFLDPDYAMADSDHAVMDPGLTEELSIGADATFEDGFHTRPSIRLPVPDHVKGILVDDWENVTRNNQLVPLPHKQPVDQIIQDYLEYERPSRDPESPHVDILEETMAGLKEYFEKSLSRILLYRFERPQYHEIRKEWEKATENGPKNVCDTYGAEHLCRLIVSLPELVAQTTMDQQSVSRLREEISKFTVWLGKNAAKYFVSEYETPAQEYIDRARNI
ncbi:hypothetical protein ACHAQA_007289 [Verticillium albo-atrum]